MYVCSLYKTVCEVFIFGAEKELDLERLEWVGRKVGGWVGVGELTVLSSHELVTQRFHLNWKTLTCIFMSYLLISWH